MTPNPKAKVEEMDREIERLSDVLADERAKTQTVAQGLRVGLRYNRILTSIARAASSPSPAPILLPFKHD